MSFFDIVLMVLIAGGAVYLLYRSIYKKKEHCGGCGGGSVCESKDKANPLFPAVKR